MKTKQIRRNGGTPRRTIITIVIVIAVIALVIAALTEQGDACENNSQAPTAAIPAAFAVKKTVPSKGGGGKGSGGKARSTNGDVSKNAGNDTGQSSNGQERKRRHTGLNIPIIGGIVACED